MLLISQHLLQLITSNKDIETLIDLPVGSGSICFEIFFAQSLLWLALMSLIEEFCRKPASHGFEVILAY